MVAAGKKKQEQRERRKRDAEYVAESSVLSVVDAVEGSSSYESAMDERCEGVGNDDGDDDDDGGRGGSKDDRALSFDIASVEEIAAQTQEELAAAKTDLQEKNAALDEARTALKITVQSLKAEGKKRDAELSERQEEAFQRLHDQGQQLSTKRQQMYEEKRKKLPEDCTFSPRLYRSPRKGKKEGKEERQRGGEGEAGRDEEREGGGLVGKKTTKSQSSGAASPRFEQLYEEGRNKMKRKPPPLRFSFKPKITQYKSKSKGTDSKGQEDKKSAFDRLYRDGQAERER